MSPWPPSTKAETDSTETPASWARNVRKRGGIEYSGHAHDAVLWEAADLEGALDHGVERVGDDKQDAVWGQSGCFGDDGGHDSHVREQQIVPAHPRAPGDAGGDDDDVGTGCLLVAVCPDHRGVGTQDGAGLQHVERLALREALDDVYQNHVGGAAVVDALCGGGADVASSDHGYFGSHVVFLFAAVHAIARAGDTSGITAPAHILISRLRSGQDFAVGGRLIACETEPVPGVCTPLRCGCESARSAAGASGVRSDPCPKPAR